MSPCVSGGAHRPVARAADRRAERKIRDAARERARGEQLLRRVERTGGQQVDLAGERRVGEEIGGDTRRRSTAAERALRTEPAVPRRRSVIEQHLLHGIVQDAPARVAKAPLDFALVDLGALGCVAGSLAVVAGAASVAAGSGTASKPPSDAGTTAERLSTSC